MRSNAFVAFATTLTFVANACRASHASSWPVTLDERTNVVRCENVMNSSSTSSPDLTFVASGEIAIEADAIVFECDVWAQHSNGGARYGMSKRLYDVERAIATMKLRIETLKNDVEALPFASSQCDAEGARLGEEVDAMERAWSASGARFVPPRCAGIGARNLIYVYDSFLGYNTWQCVCKNDYTGQSCEIAPCATTNYTTAAACGGTLRVGGECDLSCASGTVQSETLKCTLSGGVGVLNAPTCKACNACTSCSGPGRTNFDYTDHTGTDCSIPPCSLSLANGYTFRAGGSCANDANGKIPVGAACDIECPASSKQSEALTCSYSGGVNYFNRPFCTACTGDYTGANCAISPCVTTNYTLAAGCGTGTLAVGSECDLSCASGTVQNNKLKCTANGNVGVLNAPTCRTCNGCTSCSGPGRTNFDYTDHTGTDCSIPPCSLSLANGYTFRAGGSCANDANGKIPVGTACDIECPASSKQSEALTCSYSGGVNYFNSPFCTACTGDYTGANCAISPCTTSSYTAYALAAGCAGTLAVGRSCDLSCPAGKAQNASLTCTASGNTGVLNSPTCVDGCSLDTYRTSTGNTLTGGCATKSYIFIGDSCGVSCTIGKTSTALSCVSQSGLAHTSAPTCLTCAAAGLTNYTGPQCVTQPCAVSTSGGVGRGSCGTTSLPAGSNCVLSCSDGKYITRATSCSSSGGPTATKRGECVPLHFTKSATLRSMTLGQNSIPAGSFQFTSDNKYIAGTIATSGVQTYPFEYVAYKLTVSVDGYYHLGIQHDSSEVADLVMLIYKPSFVPGTPITNLLYGNDDSYNGTSSSGPWYDGYYYGTKPSAFYSLSSDATYVVVVTTYQSYTVSNSISNSQDLVCGMLDFDGVNTTYKYWKDSELFANANLERGECTFATFTP